MVRSVAWPAAGGEGGGLGRQRGAVGGVSSTRGALGQALASKFFFKKEMRDKMYTFHSELLSNSKEGVEVVLGDVDLAVVHEVENTFHVPVGDSL